MNKSTRKPSLASRLRDLVAGDGGFTLLETLAVMVIVGLLAAITVPQIAKWREKAYITSLKTDARNVANAIEAAFVDSQVYPATQAALDTLVASDVKLNPGNTVSGYSFTPATETFTFKVGSTKTTKVSTYTNAPSAGASAITVS